MEESYPTAYNLGSGRQHWDGWINVDVVEGSDLISDLHSIPIASDSADAVAAIHVVEHFYRWEVEEILMEWKRVLKPGGKMILELPCMDKVFGYVANLIMNKETTMMEFMSLHALYGDPKYKDVNMMHKWGWFTAELVGLLKHIGMHEVTVCDARYHFPFRDMRIESIK